MPSVIGLSEERERAAAQRVEVLPEEADRVLDAVPVPGSVVPSWRQGLPVSVLSPEYQRAVTVLGDAAGPLTCKELATGLGVEGAAKTKVEGVRARARRLVDRGWLVREPSGRFTLAPGPRDGGS